MSNGHNPKSPTTLFGYPVTVKVDVGGCEVVLPLKASIQDAVDADRALPLLQKAWASSVRKRQD